jgi:hypothetical protein
VVYAKATWLGQRQRYRASVHIIPDYLWATAKAAWRAYLDGRVVLVQRRDGARFDYLAIKRQSIDPVKDIATRS